MKNPVFTATLVAALSLTLAACGGGHREHHGGWGGPGGPGGIGGPAGGRGAADVALLKRFDVDNDGRITREEVQRGLKADFAKYDVDRDGFLNATEAHVVNDARRAAGTTISPAFDWNGDGHIDFTEFANQWLTLFDQFDADHDGVLTDAEMTGPQVAPGGQGGPSGHHGGHHRGGS